MKFSSPKKLILLLCFAFSSTFSFTQTTLSADGPGNTYELIESVLAPGYNPIEVPDCSHGNFGRHIDELFDNDLQTNVFRFFIHRDQDDDRCINFDRQRNEIKSYDQSPANLLGIEEETVVYSWKFKLDVGFQPSSSFTHLHQIKAVGGSEASMPQITLTARAGSPENLELRYAETNTQVTIASAPLADFKGVWVEAIETITYGESGSYELSIKRISDGVSVFSYLDGSIRMWKTDADFMRPKWGIYRSLNNSSQLRDEEVLFADFSIEEVVSSSCGFTATFNDNPLTHSGTGANTTTVSLPAESQNITFDISGISQKTNGPSSRHFSELVTVRYVNSAGSTITQGTYSASNASSASISILGEVQSVSVSLEDDLDGDSGSSQMSVSLTDISYCQGPSNCPDADGDNVCDANDVCPGFDDLQDADNDGIPDGCDACSNQTTNFPTSSLSHSGTGSTSTSVSLTNQEDISFNISGIGSKVNGKASGRYIEEVSVSYVDGSGSTINLGPFSGTNQNSAAINISGIVTQITVSLTDTYDGNSPNISVSLSDISSCQSSSSRTSQPNVKLDKLIYYPNPFTDVLNISYENDNDKSKKLAIFDIVGRVVFESTLRSKNLKLSTSNWLPGIYFIKIEGVEGQILKRIVKMK